MPGDFGGIRRGTPRQETPPDLLEAPRNGGESGGILRDRIKGRTRGDTGQSASPHHLQCGGGRGSAPLDDGSYCGCGGAGRDRKVGEAPGGSFLRSLWHGCLV